MHSSKRNTVVNLLFSGRRNIVEDSKMMILIMAMIRRFTISFLPLLMLLLPLLLIQPVVVSAADLGALAGLTNIDPNVTIDTSKGIHVTFLYSGIHPSYTMEDQVLVQLYDKNCSAGTGDNTTLMNDGTLIESTGAPFLYGSKGRTDISFSPFNPIQIEFRGNGEIMIHIQVMTSKLKGTPMLNEHNATDSDIEFCMSFAIFLEGTDIKANSLDTGATIAVGMMDSVMQFIGADDEDRFKKKNLTGVGGQFDTSITYGVIAYICNAETGASVASTLVLTQGSLLSVCVVPDAKSVQDGITLESVDLLTWTKVDADPTLYPEGLSQQAVVGPNEAAIDALTTVNVGDVETNNVIRVDTMLLATFFVNRNLDEGAVIGVGSATLKAPWMDRRRRNLKQKVNIEFVHDDDHHHSLLRSIKDEEDDDDVVRTLQQEEEEVLEDLDDAGKRPFDLRVRINSEEALAAILAEAEERSMRLQASHVIFLVLVMLIVLVVALWIFYKLYFSMDDDDEGNEDSLTRISSGSDDLKKPLHRKSSSTRSTAYFGGSGSLGFSHHHDDEDDDSSCPSSSSEEDDDEEERRHHRRRRSSRKSSSSSRKGTRRSSRSKSRRVDHSGRISKKDDDDDHHRRRRSKSRRHSSAHHHHHHNHSKGSNGTNKQRRHSS